jgi:hypothetical protein
LGLDVRRGGFFVALKRFSERGTADSDGVSDAGPVFQQFRRKCEEFAHDSHLTGRNGPFAHAAAMLSFIG